MSKKNRSAKRQEKNVSIAPAKDKSPYVHQREKLKNPIQIHQRFDLNEKQKIFIETALNKNTRLILCDGIWGSSKAQPLDAKILTPSGWKTMGEIKVGDDVFSQSGTPTKVLGIFPQGNKEIYKVTFSDGSVTECCLDHLWLTQTERERNKHLRKRNKGNPIYRKAEIPPKIRTLKEIKETLRASRGHINHSIPMVKPIEFSPQKHLIHPYILGALIGDGCLVNRVGLTSADVEIVNKIASLLPEDLIINKQARKEIEYTIVKKDKGKGIYSLNPFKEELKRLGLWGHLSYQKFVPKEYLFDSVENRIELLRGLMDTDGTTRNSYTSFTTTSLELAKNVQFLIQSLGGNAPIIQRNENFYTYKGEKKKGRTSFCVSVKMPNEINPFFLSRKKDKIQQRKKYFPIRYFDSIELVGTKPAQCILVDNPEHLYVTDECIVTHNTYLSVYCSLLLLNDKKIDSILYLRAPIESGQEIGFTPGSIQEKMNPYAEPFFQKLHEFLDEPTIKMLENDKRIEIVPPGFMRGQSWNCKAVIVDEAANFNRAMLELILSRIGPFCKVFIIGSRHQSDINDSDGFMSLFSAFDDEESRAQGIHQFSFNEESDIVRSHFTKFVMRKLGVLKIAEPINEKDWLPSESK